jgi:hypothetical protein
MKMTMTALHWFSPPHHTGHCGRVTGHDEKDSKVIRILVGMVVNNIQDIVMATLVLDCKVWLKISKGPRACS